MKAKFKNLLRDSALFAAGSAGSRLILFALVPLYTHCLSPEEYGTSDLILTIARLMIPVVTLMTSCGILRFGLMKTVRRENVAVTGAAVWLFSVAVLAALMPLAKLYRAVYEWRWYLFLCASAGGAVSLLFSYVKVKNQNRLYAAMGVLQTAVFACLNVLFTAVLRTGIQGVLLSNIAAYVLAVSLTFGLAHVGGDIRKGRLEGKLSKQMLAFSAPLILHELSWWTLQSAGKLMVAAIAGAPALGLYTAATKVPAVLNTLTSIFNQAWGISSVREMESTNAADFYSQIFDLYSAAVFGAGIFVTVIIRPFMGIFVGGSFSGAWQYVPLLLAGAAFCAIAAFFDPLFSALRKPVSSTLYTVTGAAANIAVGCVLIPRLGVWGAAIGTTAAYALLACLKIHGVKRHLAFEPNWRVYLTNAAIMLLTGAAALWNWQMLPLSGVACLAYVWNNQVTVKRLFHALKK